MNASIEVIPTGRAVGAEIRGVDFSRPVPESTRTLLRKAWADHMVLLIRNQTMNDEQLVAAGEIFGETQASGTRALYEKAGVQGDGIRFSKHPKVGIISNIDADGKPVLDNGTLGSYEVVWHSDNSHSQHPPAGSMLYSLEVPVNGGGDTSFNNQYLAWEELPHDLKRAIEGRMIRHDNSRNSAGGLRPTAKIPVTPEDVQGPLHPIARVHPITGRTALYLGRRGRWPSSYIVGLPNDESEALLDRLWAHATQEKYAWTHVWRPGDVLLWDNRCCMHYRSEVDQKQRRIMHRIVVRDVAAAA